MLRCAPRPSPNKMGSAEDIFVLDERYSTTRRVTKTEPVIVNKPEDKIKTQVFLPPNPEKKCEGGLRPQGYFKRNAEDKPLISVITVVFNGEKHIEETIQSVINQTYDNVEYIIIDGDSTDGTLDIIRQYECQIDYWVSEPDRGIYDAFNKGLKLSTGVKIGFIGSDDIFYKKAIEYVALYNNYDIVIGAVSINGKIKHGYHPSFYFFGLDHCISSHSVGLFADKNIYKNIGTYSQMYPVSADSDFILRIIKNGNYSIYPCNETEIFGEFRTGGQSNSQLFRNLLENALVLYENGSNKFLIITVLFLKLLKNIFRI